MAAKIPEGWHKVTGGKVKKGDKIRSESTFVPADALGYISVITHEYASAAGHPTALYECVIRKEKGTK